MRRLRVYVVTDTEDTGNICCVLTCRTIKRIKDGSLYYNRKMLSYYDRYPYLSFTTYTPFIDTFLSTQKSAILDMRYVCFYESILYHIGEYSVRFCGGILSARQVIF